MFHVQKQEWKGCAIATAAMLIGETYEEVAATCPDLKPADLGWPVRLRKLLQTLTQTKWRRAWLWWSRPVGESR